MTRPPIKIIIHKKSDIYFILVLLEEKVIKEIPRKRNAKEAVTDMPLDKKFLYAYLSLNRSSPIGDCQPNAYSVKEIIPTNDTMYPRSLEIFFLFLVLNSSAVLVNITTTEEVAIIFRQFGLKLNNSGIANNHPMSATNPMIIAPNANKTVLRVVLKK